MDSAVKTDIKQDEYLECSLGEHCQAGAIILPTAPYVKRGPFNRLYHPGCWAAAKYHAYSVD